MDDKLRKEARHAWVFVQSHVPVKLGTLWGVRAHNLPAYDVATIPLDREGYRG